MKKARGALLLDTKPLLELVLQELGITAIHGQRLHDVIGKLEIRRVSLWPVFTEALYFMYKDLGKRKDFGELLERVKKYLHTIGEVNLSFNEVLDSLEPSFDLADVTLLKALSKDPLLVLVSEDGKLVGKARKMGLQAVTVYELLSLSL